LEGVRAGLHCNSQAINDCESENTYLLAKGSLDHSEVIYQNTHSVGKHDSLFYTPLKTGDTVTLNAMLDSGSMACTINESAEMRLRSAGAVDESSEFKTDVNPCRLPRAVCV